MAAGGTRAAVGLFSCATADLEHLEVNTSATHASGHAMASDVSQMISNQVTAI